MAGPLCEQGHRGCAAAVLSDASLLAQAAVGLRRDVSREELCRLVREGRDPVAVQLGDGFATGLGRLVSLVASTTQVPLVIVAGEGVELAAVVEDQVRAVVAAEREPAATPVEIVLEWAGTTQWARGAAAVAIQRYVSTGPA